MELEDLILAADADLDRGRRELDAARAAREALVARGAPEAELREAEALVASEEKDARRLAAVVRALASKKGTLSAPALATDNGPFSEFERVAGAIEEEAALGELSMTEIEEELARARLDRQVREARASLALVRLKDQMKEKAKP